MKRNKLIRIVVFYLVAILLSNIFRLDLFHIHPFLESLPKWLMIFYGPLEAIGVLAGALISRKWLAREGKLQISAFGTSRKWSITMGVLPVILLFMVGVENKAGVEPHYYGLIAGISTLVYCFCEEIGWRGYLEEELKGQPELVRVLLIAGLWYIWHLTFLGNTDLQHNIRFLGWLLLGSWGLGKIVHLTKSIAVSACFHMAINIVMFNGFIRDGLSTAHKIAILGILIISWIVILVLWNSEKTLAQ